jgi:iron complex outermembrane receptor protein
MKKFFLLLILQTLLIYGQEDKTTNTLDSIYISGYGHQSSIADIPKSIYIIPAKELNIKPVESIDDILKLIPGVDIRTRGSKGVQADISIRGGNFDQVLILLNGIPVNNPQTGHHALDLPIDISMIEKIEVLEGASGQSYGVNAYSGAINIITKNPQNNKAETSLKIGQYNYLKTDWNLSHSKGKISVFNGLSYQRSDGYLTKEKINNTDFLSIKDFLHLVLETKNHPINLQLGYNQKDFGAHSFYTSKYPWQYEKTKAYTAVLSKKTGKKTIWNHSLSYRLHLDEFQLFRESEYQYQDGYYIREQDTAQYAPGYFYKGHNYHKTMSTSASTETSLKGKYGESRIKWSMSYEKIWSNVLGKDLTVPIHGKDGQIYTKSDSRFYSTLMINQHKKWKNYNAGAGINFLYNSQYKLYTSGGFYLSHSQNGWNKYFSVNSAVRIPTFTDLYYQGPSNIGNPDLKPERSYTYEGGIKYKKSGFFVQTSFFFRQGIHTIDWVKVDPEDKWQPQNLTRLNTYGIEFYIKKKFMNNNFIKQINGSYTHLYMDKKENPDLISKYALDYLKHKFIGELTHKFFYKMKTSWQFIYKERNGQYLDYIDGQYRLYDYNPYFLINIKLTKAYRNTDFSLSVENLFDTEYRDLSYIKMPGRWIIFGIKYRFIP